MINNILTSMSLYTKGHENTTETILISDKRSVLK